MEVAEDQTYELDLDLNEICRVCLSQDHQLQSLYNNTIVDGYIKSIPDMMKYCIDIEVSTTDNLPSKICSLCKSTIISYYTFKLKSLRTDNLLKKQLMKASTQQEDESTHLSPHSNDQENNHNVKDELPAIDNFYVNHNDSIDDNEFEDDVPSKPDEIFENDSETSFNTSVNYGHEMDLSNEYQNGEINNKLRIHKNMTTKTSLLHRYKNQSNNLIELINESNVNDNAISFKSEINTEDSNDNTNILESTETINVIDYFNQIHEIETYKCSFCYFLCSNRNILSEHINNHNQNKHIKTYDNKLNNKNMKDLTSIKLEQSEVTNIIDNDNCQEEILNFEHDSIHNKLVETLDDEYDEEAENSYIEDDQSDRMIVDELDDDTDYHPLDSNIKYIISEEINENTNDNIEDAYFECQFCHIAYFDETLFIKHNQDEHEICCELCNCEFNDKTAYSSHVKYCQEKQVDSENLELAFTCEQCNKRFKTKFIFEQHLKCHGIMDMVINNLEYYPCNVCHILYFTEKCLLEHKIKQHFNNDEQALDENQPSSTTIDIREEFVDNTCTEYQFLDDTKVANKYDNTDIDVDNDIEYTCGICMSTTQNIDALKQHIIKHSSRFACPFEDCGCDYDKFSKLTTHIAAKHLNTDLHQCKYCEVEPFENFDKLQEHLKYYCVERKFQCTHCDKKFFSKKALVHHINATGKKYVCQYCGKSFSQQGELTIHNRIHTGERPFKCTLCNKAYKTSSMRAAHMDAHIQGKTFPCNLCDKKLQTRTSYRNHMKRHTEEKKHSCEICGRRFFTKYHVKLHTMKIHNKASTQNVKESSLK